MTIWQNVLFFSIMSLLTIFTRALPFVLFPDQSKTPDFVRYLGQILPYPVIAMLVVYCLKEVQLTVYPNGLPEAVAIMIIVLVHFWKKNSLLSIGVGTISYMLMINMVFV